MEALLNNIVKGLVDDKDSVEITRTPSDEGFVRYHINVAKDDMGRVIGKQGRIAKAIRAIMHAASIRAGEKAIIDID